MARAVGRTAIANRPAPRHKPRVPTVAIFILGIANFAFHKAVLESGHPMLDRVAWRLFANGGKLSLASELLLLAIALFCAQSGYPAAAWVYAIYTAGNVLAAYLLLSRRI